EEKHNNYHSWLKGNENIDVIKLSAGDNNLQEFKSCNALLLSGGLDMHPKYYHQATEYDLAPERFQTDRDEFEMEAFRMALKLGKPILGICRGMQLINCVLGGTLKQDLGELNQVHRAEGKDKAHSLKIIDETILSDKIQFSHLVVNSAHHQAVDQIGNELIANCRSDDGIIEGLEWKNRNQYPFLFAVQWHPERMYKMGLQDSPLSKSIRQLFLDEIIKSIGQ
ncbi:MAG TPA: gamma-glutamyl-gamma-aminobutyrate hydrolase family protein, partial [Flavisolibacter sp.]|nr:gamma-glutamyl-gamma-aminobutyrate hydrolase family protein [Flavisolibacter sp.]